MSDDSASVKLLPVLPLRDSVIFPSMALSLLVGRDVSHKALEAAMKQERKLLLLAQKRVGDEDPEMDELHQVGTVGHILQIVKTQDGTSKLIVEGKQRALVKKLKEKSCIYAEIELVESVAIEPSLNTKFLKILNQKFEDLTDKNKQLNSDLLASMAGIEDAGVYADIAVGHMNLSQEMRQKLLEVLDPVKRVEQVIALLEVEAEMNELEFGIRDKVKKSMERNQREYFLNEQLKAVRRELGEMGDEPNEFEVLEQRVKDAGMSKQALTKAEEELSRLQQMPPMSAESSVVRGYLDWMLNMPWSNRTRLSRSLERAKEILDEDHYGLQEVKERVLDYLAVQKRVRNLRGSVLCLVGPPGVGKTSLGESIARATGRNYVRMSLGGVRDEAEIRGHRRTYIGSMPGKLLQRISRAGTRNPLFLLDEIDKIGMDHRGDPAAALLEVLDPEQNKAFNDHYLEVDFDLSEVMFVCTSNSMNIPEPLLDRMEIIRIPGYTEEEKINIAKRFLLPRQIKRNGLKENEIKVASGVHEHVVRNYTREAGVRELDRQISRLCRKVVRKHSEGKARKSASTSIGIPSIKTYLGTPKYRQRQNQDQDRVGRVVGLAWTPVGGQTLDVEAEVSPGTGKLIKTGSLGDVMQESVQAALTAIRARSARLGLPASYFVEHDLHLHVPEGATPKDGPSAGVAIFSALMSAITGIEVDSSVAMTGEITLSGEVLAIGGLKEKLLGARQYGIKTVLIPSDNEPDLAEIPAEVLKGMEVISASHVEEVVERVLARSPWLGQVPSKHHKATSQSTAKPN